MKNYITKNLIYILLGAFIAFILIFKIAHADTPGGQTVPQGGTGNTNYPLYLPVLTGTSTLRFASATSTLYLKIGGVLSPIFTATSTNSYFFAGAIPVPNFSGAENYCGGRQACSLLTSGSNNVALGTFALLSDISGGSNTALGRSALISAESAENTAVGMLSGVTVDTGIGNTFLGYGADVTADPYNFSIAIGHNALVTGSNKAVIGGEIGTGYEVKLGVGTTSPGTIFSLGDFEGVGAGAINFDLGTSTFFTTGGINLKDGGCFAVKGVCVGGSGGGSGTVNSGVAGQTAFYNTTGTAVSGTSTLSIGTTTVDMGNVGIGTSSPTGKLTIATKALVGATTALTLQTLDQFSGQNISNSIIQWKAQNGANQAFVGSFVNVADPGNIEIGNNGTTNLTVASNGNVGIGTTLTTAPLTLPLSTGAKIFLYPDTAGNRYGVGIQGFDWQSFIPAVSNVHFSWNKGGDIQTDGTNELMRLDQNGNLGLGTTSPSAELSVQSNSTSVNPFLVATSTTGTLFYIDPKGNQYVAGDLPKVGTCGTNPSIAAGSNNNAGRITAGSGGGTTACTVTFADGGFTATQNAPVCTANDENGTSVALEAAASQTAIVITGGSFTSHVITYRCTGF